MLIDSQIYYRNFYEKYVDEVRFNEVMSGDCLDNITESMNLFLHDFSSNYSEIRQSKYHDCIALLESSSDDVISQVAIDLRSADFGKKVVSTTINSIYEHISLIKHWSEIVRVCDNTILKEEAFYVDAKREKYTKAKKTEIPKNGRT